jgi:hypothetical protein
MQWGRGLSCQLIRVISSQLRDYRSQQFVEIARIKVVRYSVSHFVQPADEIPGRIALPPHNSTAHTERLLERQPRWSKLFRRSGYLLENIS